MVVPFPPLLFFVVKSFYPLLFSLSSSFSRPMIGKAKVVIPLPFLTLASLPAPLFLSAVFYSLDLPAFPKDSSEFLPIHTPPYLTSLCISILLLLKQITTKFVT